MARNRKMTDETKEVLRRHDDHRDYILGREDWTDEQKAFFLSGRNCAVEDVLHANKCYHGFRYVDAQGNALPLSMFKDEAGQPKALTALQEQCRQYYRD